MTKATLRPPYSILYLFDPDTAGDDAPTYDGSLTRAGETCAYIGTRSSDDGPVTVWIEEGPPSYEVKYDVSHELSSVGGSLHVETVDGKVIGKLREQVGPRTVRICADDEREPTRINVWSAE